MSSLMTLLSLCALLLQGGATPAQAPEEATWSVAGREVLHIRATVANMTPRQRVEELDDRLNNMLSKADGPIMASNIVVKHIKGAVCIMVNGDLLITVSDIDATANRMKVDKLAHVWLSNIRKTVPQLSPKENRRGA